MNVSNSLILSTRGFAWAWIFRTKHLALLGGQILYEPSIHNIGALGEYTNEPLGSELFRNNIFLKDAKKCSMHFVEYLSNYKLSQNTLHNEYHQWLAR